MFLNDVLACEDFCGGVEPRIGQKHIRVLAIDGFPRSSSPGLLRELDSLSVEYRWNTRAVMLDAQEAEAILDKTRKKWRSKIRGWRDQILENRERRRKSLCGGNGRRCRTGHERRQFRRCAFRLVQLEHHLHG